MTVFPNPVDTYFADVPDPRSGSNAQVHLLVEILTISLCAMLSGAESFVDMEVFGKEKKVWLKSRLGLKLPGGVPSHDTIGRLFASLEPRAFGAAMQAWTRALHRATQGQVVALDGKRLRRSFDRAHGQGAIHLVNAWAADARLVLGQCAVDKKSNEITAIPTLLEMLDVRGCIITTDALNSQKEIARRIKEKEAEYVLALKDNHALLFEEVRDYFQWCKTQPGGLERLADSSAQNQHWGHGRSETRRCFAIAATQQDWPDALRAWPGLRSLVMVECVRRVNTPGVNTPGVNTPGVNTPGVNTPGVNTPQDAGPVHQRFYLSSLPPDAVPLLEAVRAHWGVENKVHWCLDVAFDEDGSRVRKDNAPENLGGLRRLCLNLLLQEDTHKKGIKGRRLRAAWNHDYLLKLICTNNS